MTDAWTSPNHYMYVAVNAHIGVKSEPVLIVLDVIGVAKVMIT